jgi:3-dehydroquinate synthase
LVGAFFQPLQVIADIAALETLPVRQVRAGYAEVVKYGLINDRPFFQWLERHGAQLLDGDRSARRQAVVTSCKAKAAIVAADERESGERALLNLGHTFAHALEAESAYADSLLHGEAVAVGMVLAFDFSVQLGLCSPEDADRVRHHLTAVGLPTRISALERRTWSADAIVRRMEQDKKVQNGKLTLVLARGIGKSFIARDADRNRVHEFLTAALAD